MRKQMLVTGVLIFFVSASLLAQCIQGNCQNGYGIYTYKSGATYKGDFRNGQISGQGILYFSNGDKYMGEWKNQRREGKGKMVFANGDIYQGNFIQNKFHGQGTMKFFNGDHYKGAFLDGKFSGEGTMFYANGDKYVGHWYNNKKHGQGKLYQADGPIKEGNWVRGALIEENETNPIAISSDAQTSDKNLKNCNTTYCESGQGFFTYSDGSKYVGYFKNGKPEGRGTCYYANGDKYVGEWKNHAPHGEGILTMKNNKVIAAIWSAGRPIRQLEVATAADPIVKIDENSDVKIWSVVVGISRYEHMPVLRFTDDDAYRFYAFLKSPEGGALTEKQVKILIDEDATRNNILMTLKETLLKADKNDVIVFYYSGHGLDGSFIPVDYDGFNNRLLHDEIKSIFEQSQAKHKIIFADACYSGSLLAMKAPFHQMIKKYYESFEHTKGGLAFFTSSQGAEISLEDGGLRQGIFTHFLIRGLNGEADVDRNKIVTINELYTFVKKHVRSYTAKVQTPVITGKYDGNMPVAVIR